MSRTPPQSCPSGTRIRKVKARESGAGVDDRARRPVTTAGRRDAATLQLAGLSPGRQPVEAGEQGT